MKAIIKRKNIYIEPKPNKDIPYGLYVVFNKETEILTKYAYTDIIKGQSKYLLPFLPEDNRKIIKAIINKSKKALKTLYLDKQI